LNIGGVFDISVGEVAEIVEKVNQSLHKDKKDICLHLEIVNAGLQDWYNDIIEKFSPWVANNMKVESSDLDFIYKCTKDSKRKTIAENSIGLLQYMAEHSGKGKGKGKKGFKGRIDIDKIVKARDSITDFYEQTVLEKGEWLRAAINKQPFSRDRVMEWHDRLDNDRKSVNESLSSVKRSLKCEHISNDQLEKYRL
jgi:hypothetical protein